jgi:hypothetical protein
MPSQIGGDNEPSASGIGCHGVEQMVDLLNPEPVAEWHVVAHHKQQAVDGAASCQQGVEGIDAA